MIKITHIEPHSDFTMSISFSDGLRKDIDFKPFIGRDVLSSALSDYSFFSKARVYDNGRGIYWPNDFDFCPDFLHSYAA